MMVVHGCSTYYPKLNPCPVPQFHMFTHKKYCFYGYLKRSGDGSELIGYWNVDKPVDRSCWEAVNIWVAQTPSVATRTAGQLPWPARKNGENPYEIPR